MEVEMKEIIIDGRNLSLGRLASFVAKKALNGNRVVVLNAEKTRISGNLGANLSKFKQRSEAKSKGKPTKSPKLPRRPDMLFRRVVRGMLPWKKAKGREAFRRVSAFVGMPEEFKNKKLFEVSGDLVLKTEKSISLEKISQALGYKLRVSE